MLVLVQPLLEHAAYPPDDRGIRRVAARALETTVTAMLARLLPGCDVGLAELRRVDILPGSLQLVVSLRRIALVTRHLADDESVSANPADPDGARIVVPIDMRLRGGRTTIIGGAAVLPRRDAALIRALRMAHALVAHDRYGLPHLDAAPASAYLRRIVRLACLAPDLQRAILDGRQPPELTLERLLREPIPLAWAAQTGRLAR